MAHAIDLNTSMLQGTAGGLFARLARAFADFRGYHATYAELSALSDRELADIGLSRHNIQDVARESVVGS